MTDAEKITAFDRIVTVMTNQWASGSWSWWCPTPCGGLENRATREEAVADLVVWAERMAKRKRPARTCQP